MRTPSEKLHKPHFFHPIKTGFKDGIMIPKSFLGYMKGIKCGIAVLRRGHKKWPVKITGMKIEEGWRKFGEDNDLKVGDFLMFKYEGNLVFKVKIFDKNGCPTEVEPGKPVEVVLKSPSQNLNFNRSEESTGKQSRKLSGGKSSEHPYPHFLTTLKPYSIKHSKLHIPMEFVRENGMSSKTGNVILKNQMQKIWIVSLRRTKNYVYIGRGWKDFRIGNELKEGDHLVIKLINGGETPVMQIYGASEESDLRGEESAPSGTRKPTHADGSGRGNEEQVTHCEVKPSFVSTRHNPYFVYTVKPTKWPYLSIPMELARSNGLDKHCCEVILMDSGGRTWSAEIEPKAREVIVRRGWVKFLLENGLKEGDTINLELINKGDKPIIKIPWQLV